jgi:SAM-dependent methyltransferase
MAFPSPLALARRLTGRGTSASRPPASAHPVAADTQVVRFQCNLCGQHNAVAASALARETPSCAHCKSTVRLRAVAHLVVQEMLGATQALPQVARRDDIAGLGISDDPRYAKPLARAFAYENTQFHAEPRLDITAVPPERAGRYDFVIASDVFEHVLPPVDRAFRGARALLKPGGVFVFTVPFSLDEDTVEHFPELCDWRLDDAGGRWRLTNVTADGRTQTFDDLVFHGGPGSTLEMRLFSRAALERAFAAAGFARVRIAAEPCPRFGIEWPEPWSVPMVAYAG